MAFVLATVEPGASDERVQMFARMIHHRARRNRWGEAELAWAALELPFDTVVNDKLRFNRPVMPADFERLVEEIRSLRCSLRFPMSARQRQKLIERYAGEIDSSRFHVCGFDRDNQPLYRYAPHLAVKSPDPIALLTDE